MTDIYAQKLEGKTVVDSNGKEIGYLQTVTANFATGDIKQLVIMPIDNEKSENEVNDLQPDDDGVIRVPIRQIQSVKDYIVINKSIEKSA